LRRPKHSKIEVVAPKEEDITIDERFKAYLFFHLPPGLTLRRSTLCPQSAICVFRIDLRTNIEHCYIIAILANSFLKIFTGKCFSYKNKYGILTEKFVKKSIFCSRVTFFFACTSEVT
jgi:hypothetical protein